MKKLLKFLLIKRESGEPLRHGKPEPKVFDRIAKRFPEWVDERKISFKVVMEADDLKLAKLMNFLEHELGLRALVTESASLNARHDDDQTFVVKTSYEFDEQDIEDAKFLVMSMQVEVGSEGYNGKDWDQRGLQRARRRLPLIGHVGCAQVCTNAVREELEREGFGGLDFLPVLVHDPRYRQGDFWRIWANRSMPKVSMPLCDAEGNPVKVDYSTGCYPDEIILNQRILKYRAVDLAAMSGTDFALTAEKWGSPKARIEREVLVVSQRFRQWCLKKNVQAKWTPVIALPD